MSFAWISVGSLAVSGVGIRTGQIAANKQQKLQEEMLRNQPKQITEQDPVVLRAAEDERRRQKNAQGRQSTITAPLVSSNTQNFKTILGG